MFVWTIRDALLMLVFGFFTVAFVAFHVLGWVQSAARRRRRRRESEEAARVRP